MISVLQHKDGSVRIAELPTGGRRVDVVLTSPLYSPCLSCTTDYPPDLIGSILELKGPDYLCDEILRDEAPDYVQKALRFDLSGYLDDDAFRDRRLLDFGCGSGASTMILARMFPHTRIVGIELDEKSLAVARLRAKHHGCRNVEFLLSPGPDSLPPDLGRFDFIVLSAVFEHLLPDERRPLLLKIWDLLQPGGVLFLDQTPYRYFPVELHTTSGLPLINYLPDMLALRYARRCSKRGLAAQDWTMLLRNGIRGGSVGEIMGILRSGPDRPVLLEPSRFGMKDTLDLWYIQSGDGRFPGLKKVFLVAAKMLRRLTGFAMVPSLSLAFRKDGAETAIRDHR